MSNDKHQSLRDALSAGPTPGPWFHGAKNGTHKYCVYDKICWTDEYGRHGDIPNMVIHVSPDDGRFREAAYIAAANPAAIQSLLADHDRMRAALLTLRDNPFASGVWREVVETALKECEQ